MVLKRALEDSIALKTRVLNDIQITKTVDTLAKEMVSVLRSGKKILFCGNGGSAADAQHLAAELSGRFYYDRPPLAAEALHVNTSFLTAVANDYSFDDVYARMIRAYGNKGDMLIGISTSGNSVNVVKALETANELGLKTAVLSGKDGGKTKALVDHCIIIPSDDTPRIQELHMIIGHSLCEIVEQTIFPQ
ncbi:MAG: D-sedoheptulose 7-phosphate isomerase [Bacteroidales bacterium]|nr:D-sedoheptulose 7-phosphate isomerase [Bacteroidales bacterium]RLD36113.1 MAG: phosphoheptose isomerase [Bacteroidota bacterium]